MPMMLALRRLMLMMLALSVADAHDAGFEVMAAEGAADAHDAGLEAL